MLSEFLLTELHAWASNKLPLHRQLYEALRRAMLDGKLSQASACRPVATWHRT